MYIKYFIIHCHPLQIYDISYGAKQVIRQGYGKVSGLFSSVWAKFQLWNNELHKTLQLYSSIQSSLVNGSQLAIMKKSISDMSLP